MRDPFYAHLIFQIEHLICAADREAGEKGLILKDSQVQSALTKAKGLAGGKTPKFAEATEADRVLLSLIDSIHHAPAALREQSTAADGSQVEKPLRIADWIIAIEAVIDSVKTRRSTIPGSRDYLDFVRKFVAQALGQK